MPFQFPISNDELEDLFKELSVLMDLHGENEFKAKSYQAISFQISRLQQELSILEPEQIKKIPSLGSTTGSKIIDIFNTGQLPQLDELRQKTPEGLFEILKIKGLGPKKVRSIWQQLEIENIGELEYACEENRLKDLKGFGEKTQTAVLESIQFLKSNRDKFFYSEGNTVATQLLEIISHELPDAQVQLTGELRRKCNTLSAIELITTAEPEQLEFLTELEYISEWEPTEEGCSAKFLLRYPIKIICCPEEEFAIRLFFSTGSEKHVEQINVSTIETYKDETEIYEAAGLSFIEPELREGTHEVVLARQNQRPILLTDSDIKGVIHLHTNFSDGKNTLKEMADRAIELGYQYMCVSDHSQTASYAGGLSPQRVIEQQVAIEKLNIELAPFRIFSGIESDILGDGSLDYTEDVLQTFDFVIASVHQNIYMNEETAMRRLLTAINNPYTTFLGHPTGRLLLSRKGYPINHKAIIDACAKKGVVIELNASPYRLDLDWAWIPYAMEKGVLISINPDAHKLKGIEDIQFGVASARKGGLTASNCFNYKTATEANRWFLDRKRKL